MHFQKGDPTIYNGDLFTVGNTIIDKDNISNGNLRAGGSITVDRKATVMARSGPATGFVIPPDAVMVIT